MIGNCHKCYRTGEVHPFWSNKLGATILVCFMCKQFNWQLVTFLDRLRKVQLKWKQL